MSPAATYALNCASVGAGSEPLQPPIAMTALPLANSSDAALWSPTVAAAQRVVAFLSKAASAEFADVPPPPCIAGVEPLGAVQPPNPPRPKPPADVEATAGPADAMLPVCAVVAVFKAYAIDAPVTTTRPALATAMAARRVGTRSATAPPRATTSSNGRSHGFQSGERASSWKLHRPVTATPAASATRAAISSRRRQSTTAPM